jgi:type VII secretion protein EccB
LVQNTRKDADWTVCDAASGTTAGVTVIAGVPDGTGARAAALDTGKAILVSNPTGAWLLWDGRRSRIDLADHAVTSALGLGTEVHTPRPVAAGLFNAIPESPPLAAPGIPEGGGPARFPVPAPIGGVVESHGLEGNSSSYYAVLPDGLQQISPVLAAMLRNANSYGLDQPPRLGADKVAKLPVSRQLDTSRYPEQRISLLDATHDPVTCAHWSKASGASTNSLTLLAGSALPIPDAVHTADLVGAGAGGTASRVAMAPGSGYFAQTVGQNASSPAAGSLFWISDTGVRYGIDNEAAQGGVTGNAKTAEALGLSSPATPIPWSILSLYAPGPTLSRADALLAHDGLAPDSRPGRISAEGQPR